MEMTVVPLSCSLRLTSFLRSTTSSSADARRLTAVVMPPVDARRCMAADVPPPLASPPAWGGGEAPEGTPGGGCEPRWSGGEVELCTAWGRGG